MVYDLNFSNPEQEEPGSGIPLPSCDDHEIMKRNLYLLISYHWAGVASINPLAVQTRMKCIKTAAHICGYNRPTGELPL